MIADTPPAIIIQWDRGGRGDLYAQKYEGYKREGREVRIAGRCSSACTLALSLPKVCVYPQATLGFHAARYAWSEPTSGAVGGAVSPEWTAWVWNFYPQNVKTRLGTLTPEMRYLSGAELIASGVKRCPDDGTVGASSFFTGLGGLFF